MPPTSVEATPHGSSPVGAGAAPRVGEGGTEPAGNGTGRVHPARLLFGLVLLAALVTVVSHLGDARHFAEMLRRARPAWVLFGVVLQAATYCCAGGTWWLVLRRMSSPLPLRTMIVLSVAKLFTDQAAPSGGISGSAMMVGAVERRGVPAPAADASVIVGLLGYYPAMIIATLASLPVFSEHHGATAVLVVLTAMLLLIATVVGVSLIVLVRGSDTRLRRWLGRRGRLRELLDSFARVPRDVIRDRALLARSFGLQLTNVVLDAATLQVMLAAVGEHVEARVVFGSFVFASLAEMSGVAPGGVGTFEGTCVWLVRLSGVGLEPAFTATMLLRGFTFWLPMFPGLAIVRREVERR